MSPLRRGKEDPLREQPMQERRKKLGDILMERGVITQRQIEKALEEQRKEYRRFGEILRDLRIVPETELVKALAEQLHVEIFSLNNYEPDEKVAGTIPEEVARRTRSVPVEITEDGEVLKVAVRDPLDVAKMDDLKRLSGLAIEPIIGTQNEIDRALNRGVKSPPAAK